MTHLLAFLVGLWTGLGCAVLADVITARRRLLEEAPAWAWTGKPQTPPQP